jgi:hypothetical protein
MAATDEIERAQWELDKALADLTRSGGKGGGGVENRYGQAYQRLVLLGAAPQLRRKYRQ